MRAVNAVTPLVVIAVSLVIVAIHGWRIDASTTDDEMDRVTASAGYCLAAVALVGTLIIVGAEVAS